MTNLPVPSADPQPAHRLIAIVGLGACLPDAPNVATFWQNLQRGHVAIDKVPPERWSPEIFYSEDRKAMDRTYSQIGGFIRYDPFDAKRFRVVPKSLPAIDALQKWALVAVAEALGQAGLKVFAKDEAGRAFNRERCATIFGNAMGGEAEDRTSLRVWLLEVEAALAQSAQQNGRSPAEAARLVAELHAHYAPLLPSITEDSMPGELSNCITGRIANVFDLCGANFTTDAACASTMAAVQAGVRGLLEHEFDTALVGGADKSMDPPTYVKFSRIGALSPDRSTPFDAGANGFVMGEGVGVLVLKRYEDALREGHQIMAVIHGLGASSDGRGKGMTAPNPRGQRLAVQRAWQQAGLSLAQAGLIEAHGTSTAVGDAVEAEVLTTLLEEAGHKGAPIALGSIKSMIGHLKSAAGAASLIKATLALHHRVLPPSPGFVRASETSPLRRGRLAVQQQAAPWPDGATPRLAGISSFGFGGTNFHVVLGEAPTVAAAATQQAPPASLVAAPAGQAAPLAAGAPAGRDAQGLLAEVTALFAEATGYAASELEPEHHLEADLGIDSVKQAEVMAALRGRYGLAEEVPTKLSELDTLARIASYVARHTGAQPAPPGAAAGAAPAKMQAAAPAAGGPDRTDAQAAGPLPPGAPAGASLPRVFACGGATLAEAVAAGRQAVAQGPEAWHRAARQLSAHAVRVVLVAQGADEALQKLNDAEQKGLRAGKILAAKGIFVASGPGLATGHKLAFLFPGQGSQYLGMLQDLAGQFAVVAQTFAEADAVLEPLIGHGLTAKVWPEEHSEQNELALRETQVCQPAMLTADVALMRLLQQFGVRPDVVVGHSLGEYAAAVTAGVLSFADALYAVSARGREMAGVQVDDPGRMAMVAADAARVEAVLAKIPGYVIAANKNCHTQTVIAGNSAAVEAALAAFAAEGLEARPIAVSHAFHSNIVAPAAAPLRRVLQKLDVRPPKLPLSSNVDAAPYPDDPAAIVDRMALQLASPVQFIDQVENLYQGGARLFVEVGPKRAITGFVRNILGQREHRALATNHPKKSGDLGLWEALAALMAEGLPVDLSGRAPPPAALANGAPRPAAGAPASKTAGAAPPASAARPPVAKVVISGTSVLLPGCPAPAVNAAAGSEDWRQDPYAPLLAGTNLVQPVAPAVQQDIVAKNVLRLDKQSGRFVPLRHARDVVQHAGKMAEIDLNAYGIDAALIDAMDVTAKLTVAAGLDALRDAGLPLVAHRRVTSTGRTLHDRWGLPPAVGTRTGVILGSAFPSLEAILRDVRAAEDAPEGRVFDRKWLFRALPMGHAQLAQIILAQGPNTQLNAACASGTQALAMAADWIQLGRCDRVVVVTADDITQKDALTWVGAGFLAAGAASVEPDLARAAVPFGAERNGLILGGGAAAFVVEREDAVLARGLVPVADLLAANFANSAFHGTRLNEASITDFLAGMVAQLVAEDTPAARAALAQQMVFLSHETYTPARGGSAAAEVGSLRHIFADGVQALTIANTKGFTGHPMGASFEDVIACKGLQRQIFPPIANFHRPDPAFADLRFAAGGAVTARFALRFAAGFGSQVAACAYGRRATQEARLAHPALFADWCAAHGMDSTQGFEVHHRTLRLAAAGNGQPPWALGIPSLARAGAHADAALSDAAPASAAAAAPSTDVLPPLAGPAASPGGPAPAPTQPVAAATAGPQVLGELIALFAEQTGYVPEELDPTQALEADLGIDSVKQAEIFAQVRQRYGIDAGAPLAPQDVPTLAALADWVVAHRRAPAAAAEEAATVTPATASSAPQVAPQLPTRAVPPPQQAQVLAELTQIFAEQTGYAVADLEPEHALEADLGIDSVKQAEVLALVRTRYQVAAHQEVKLSEVPTLAALAAWVLAAAAAGGEASVALPAPVAGTPAPAPRVGTPAPAPSGPAPAQRVAAPARPGPAPAAGAAAASSAAPATEGQVLAELTALFAEDTGYDVADLAADHALEADLGIDSVKQAELFAKVRARYQLAQDPDFRLAEVQTLAAMAAYVVRQLPGGLAAAVPSGIPGAAAAPAAAPAPPPRAAASAQAAARGNICARQVVLLPLPPPAPAGPRRARAAGQNFAVFGAESAAAEALVAALAGLGHRASLFSAPSLPAKDATVVCVVTPGSVELAFAHAQAWARQDARPARLLAVGLGGGGFGLLGAGADPVQASALAQVAALYKTLAKEWPDSHVVTLDVTSASAGAVPSWGDAAEQLCALAQTEPAQWGYHEVVAVPAGPGADCQWLAPARAAGALAPAPRPLPAMARVVATGGARGITYALLLEMAKTRPLDVVVLGRTPATRAQDSVLYGRSDAEQRALAKSALEQRGQRATPAAVRAWIAAERSQVEVGQNLAALEALGCSVALVCCDLADAQACQQAAAQLAQAGLATALLLHGAGYEESKRIEDKDAQALARTKAPKLTALAPLVAALRPARVVTMGSIAGRFGNAAQSDYAVANEALAAGARTAPEQNTLNIGWTAWGDIGMAERGSVRRVLEAHGVALMPASVGVSLGQQLIESAATGDVVVAGPLGTLAAGERLLPALFDDLQRCAGADPQAAAPAASNRWILRRTFSPSQDLGLDHHRIDGTAVLPGVLGVELMAVAGAWWLGAAPSLLTDVQFAAPIKFFRDAPLTVEVELAPEGQGLHLAVYTHAGPRGSRKQHFSAHLPKQPGPRPAYAADAFVAAQALPHFGAAKNLAKLSQQDIYRRYFHGPSFQVLAAHPRLSDAGVQAQVAAQDVQWLAKLPQDHFLTEPYLREAGFQAAGLFDMVHERRMALPSAIAELWLVPPAQPAPAAAQVQVRCHQSDATGSSYDVALLRGDQLVGLMRGFRTIALRPLAADEQFGSDAPPAATAPSTRSGSQAHGAAIARERLALGEVQALLAPENKASLSFYLSAAERQRLGQLRVKKRRLDWLAGRLAAKALLRRTWPVPATRPHWRDMTIAADAEGEPEVLLEAEHMRRQKNAPALPAHPRISISHSGDVAMSVVSWDPAVRIGIDVEQVEARDPAFARSYFTAAERRWAAGTQDAAKAYTVLWAIKEAALKALGVAARVDLRALEVRAAASGAAAADAWAGPYRLTLLGDAHKLADQRSLRIAAVEVHCAAAEVVAQVSAERTTGRAVGRGGKQAPGVEAEVNKAARIA